MQSRFPIYLQPFVSLACSERSSHHVLYVPPLTSLSHHSPTTHPPLTHRSSGYQQLVLVDSNKQILLPISGMTTGQYISLNVVNDLAKCTSAPPPPPSPPPVSETNACFMYSSLDPTPSVPFKVVPNGPNMGSEVQVCIKWDGHSYFPFY